MSRSLVGTIETLFVERKSESGYIITHAGESIFLQEDEVSHDLDTGDYVKVFLYGNDNGRLVATTQLPHIVMGESDWATVVKIVPRIGLFVSIGTTTDILVPKDYLPFVMKAWPHINDKLYISLDLDRQGRLLAIPASEQDMESMLEYALPENVNLNDRVTGTVYYTSREGAVMLTDDNYRGFIHNTEREREPRLGEHVTGRVIEVKDDGTLNVSLLPMKHERIDEDGETILKYLNEHDGVMSFNDRSDAQLIRDTFNMSKSAFKRALGRLMREKKIEQDEDGTTLIDEQSE